MINILLYLLIPIIIFLLLVFGLPYIFKWYIYNVQQESLYAYSKNTVLYIKKKNKKIKKNDLICYHKKIYRVVAVNEENAIVRDSNTSDIIILKIKDGIDTIKFNIPKIGIVLSFFKNIKKKVKRK